MLLPAATPGSIGTWQFDITTKGHRIEGGTATGRVPEGQVRLEMVAKFTAGNTFFKLLVFGRPQHTRWPARTTTTSTALRPASHHQRCRARTRSCSSSSTGSACSPMAFPFCSSLFRSGNRRRKVCRPPWRLLAGRNPKDRRVRGCCRQRICTRLLNLRLIFHGLNNWPNGRRFKMTFDRISGKLLARPFANRTVDLFEAHRRRIDLRLQDGLRCKHMAIRCWNNPNGLKRNAKNSMHRTLQVAH